jgi:Fe-S-cluster containining protein
MPSDPSFSSSTTEIFDCRQCGDCCKGFGGTYVSPDDIQAIATFIGVDPESFHQRFCQPSGKKRVLAQGENGYCIFWNDRLCTIHPVKPRMCKAWPYIPGVLKDPQNWYIMASMCPGIRTDVSPAEIVACIRSKNDASS